MIVFKDIKPQNKYGAFFLAKEAPGDSNDIETAPADQYNPAGNTRVINVTPGERTRRLNFDDPDDQPVPTAPTVVQPIPSAPMQQPTPVNPTDVQVADGAAGASNGAGIPDPNGPVQDPNAVADPGAAPEEGGDGPITDDGGDALNFSDPDEAPAGDGGDTDDIGDFSNADGGGEAGASDASGDQQQSNGYGIEVDSTRRFKLFEEFIALDAAVKGYIEKLENFLSDDPMQTQVAVDSQRKLKRIRELLHDYMLLKFESAPYDNSYLFYSLIKTSILRIFARIEKVNKLVVQEKELEASKKGRKI